MRKLMLNIIVIALFTNILLFNEIVAQSEVMSKTGSVENIIDKVESFALSERTITTAVIIFEVFLLLLILHYWKRTNRDTKIDSQKLLKRNINAIRNEKIRPVFVEDDKLRRSKIFRAMNKKKFDGKLLTATAKKLEVSKGELLLAVKINQLQRTVK